MKISTKGRYALRIMLDLAENGGEEYVKLTDIARRQEISEKYMEAIVSLLSKKGMITGQRGKGGGYRLVKSPKEYSVGEIIKTAEGSISPVSCLENQGCHRRNSCKTLALWQGLEKVVDEYLNGISLWDLAEGLPYNCI